MSSGPTAPRLLPVDELNCLPASALGEALRPLFEAADPLAERLAPRRPFASYDELLEHAAEVVASLPEPLQVAVVNAHPRIGAPPDLLRRESLVSYREQGYDREAGADEAQLRQLARDLDELNRAYETRFGFRFVVFVNRRPRLEILKVLEQRLPNPREQELATALRDMLAIARDRLVSMRA